MEQLILHLFGDYITQTHWMATEKTRRFSVALIHAIVYTVPFVLLTSSFLALLVICLTHAVIDRYKLAVYVVYAKNWLTDRSLKWSECSSSGYPSCVPSWLAVWLVIIADNTIHISINYAAIRWL